MGSPFLRLMGLFDPSRSMPQGIGLQNSGIFGPETVKSGRVFSVPNVTVLGAQVPNLPDTAQQSTQPNGTDLSEIERIFKSIYTPSYEYSDRLKGLLDTMPTREEPSTFRKIGSIFTGLGYGPKAQDEFLYEPYNKEMADWKARYDPTLQAANIERYGNTEERMGAYQAATVGIREQAEQRRREDMQNDFQIAQDRNRIQTESAQGRLWQRFDAGDGFVWRINPESGEKYNTGIKSRFLTPEQRIQMDNADNEAAMARARVSASNRVGPTVYNFDEQNRPRAGTKVRLPDGSEVTIPLNEATPEQIQQYYQSQQGQTTPTPVPTPTPQPQPTPTPTPVQPTVTPQSTPTPDVRVTGGMNKPQPAQPQSAPTQPVQPQQGKPVIGRPAFNPQQQVVQRRTEIEALKARLPITHPHLNPEWIQIDANGNPSVTPPQYIPGSSYQTSGPSESAYRELVEMVFPGSKGIHPPPTGLRPGGTWIRNPTDGRNIYLEPQYATPTTR